MDDVSLMCVMLTVTQLESSHLYTIYLHCWIYWIPLLGLCLYAHRKDMCSCVRVSTLFVCRHVGGCVGVRAMQVNSLRRPTAPRASLAHHLTAIPDEGLRTNELVRQMSDQAREGWRRVRRAAAVAPARPVS